MDWKRLITGMVSLLFISVTARAGTLPTITTPPVSQIVNLGNNATFSVAAQGATSYQWRFNGTNISGANAATLVITNAQANQAGYYSVLAENATGWVPGGLTYLSVLTSAPGVLPFNNTQDTNSAVYMDSYTFGYVTNGTAQVVAGPQLDQMQTLTGTAHVGIKGRFSGNPGPVALFASLGQTIYYRVDVTYTYNGEPVTQPSAVLSYVVTNTSSFGPSDFCVGLRFPVFIEWPTPYFEQPQATFGAPPTNAVVAPGETINLLFDVFDQISDLPPGSVQWRKDGQNIPGANQLTYPGTNAYMIPSTTFSITNVQPSDAGVYDVVAQGFYQPAISYEFALSVQISNGPGTLQSPRVLGTNFVCDLAGIGGRQYDVQWSTNLTDWHDLVNVSNAAGFMTFSNAIGNSTLGFYRSKLLPY